MERDTTEEITDSIAGEDKKNSSFFFPGATGLIDSSFVNWGPSNQINPSFTKDKEIRCNSLMFKQRWRLLIQRNEIGVKLLMEKEY